MPKLTVRPIRYGRTDPKCLPQYTMILKINIIPDNRNENPPTEIPCLRPPCTYNVGLLLWVGLVPNLSMTSEYLHK